MPKKIKAVKSSNVKKSCLVVPIEEAHLLVALCDKGVIDATELRKRIFGS